VSKISFFLSLLLSITSFGHPVSFKDGTGLMSYNSQSMNELLLTYSFSPSFAVATTYLRDSKSEFYIPRLDFLLKRWNLDDSQGNIYFSGGAGLEKFNLKSYGVRLAELVADWESREYYVSLTQLYLNRDNDLNALLPLKEYNHTKARVGFAPFLADYNDLNVWLILEANKHNRDEQIELVQFVRMFRKNVLWEVGAGFDGSLAFNFMVHL
jgi:hypothetical protein